VQSEVSIMASRSKGRAVSVAGAAALSQTKSAGLRDWKAYAAIVHFGVLHENCWDGVPGKSRRAS
jgi:hypothetical protein